MKPSNITRARSRSQARQRFEQQQQRHERRIVALLDAALPALRLLARDEHALHADWVFVVFSQGDVDVEYAPPEIIAAMRGLCPEEPVVALLPVQRFVDELTPEAARDPRVISFFQRAREPAGEGRLKVIVFIAGRYELVGAVLDPLRVAGEA